MKSLDSTLDSSYGPIMVCESGLLRVMLLIARELRRELVDGALQVARAHHGASRRFSSLPKA